MEISEGIKSIRKGHPGWGGINIQIELEDQLSDSTSSLPSISSINRFLSEQGFIQKREASSKLPTVKGCGDKKIKKPHDRWELDAQGSIVVKGIGHQSMINAKDAKSKLHCIAFPVRVANGNTQPSGIHYQWALRTGFMEWGLPRSIQVDKDSVFIENRSKSPFPKMLHLWLIALGVELCFIKKPPPANNAMVERSHQTMQKQVIDGQTHSCWKHFFHYCQKRRKRMNEKIPNRLLGQKPPLKAYPKAAHSTRPYSLDKEAQLLDLKRVYRYLARCTWFRLVSKAKTVSLGGHVYYLKAALPGSELQIHFCNRSKKFVFRDANELVVAMIPPKNLSIEDIMGATTKSLISTWYKLNHYRAFPF